MSKVEYIISDNKTLSEAEESCTDLGQDEEGNAAKVRYKVFKIRKQ